MHSVDPRVQSVQKVNDRIRSSDAVLKGGGDPQVPRKLFAQNSLCLRWLVVFAP
jgi:hypothetical protein